MEVKVDIHTVNAGRNASAPYPAEPGEDLARHRVSRPEPRVCTNELELARAFNAVLVDEWDGAPFRFYFDDTIPESERMKAGYAIETVARLSERLEAQLGYSVLQWAGWIGEDERGFGIADDGGIEDCEGVRPGGIVTTVIPHPSVGARAFVQCGVVAWVGDVIYMSGDGAMPHEIFHLLGFAHSPDSPPDVSKSPPGVGVPMSLPLTMVRESGSGLGVTFEDVDALRCILPEGG